MIKATGAEFWKFYTDPKYWIDGVWHDDTLLRANGEIVEDYSNANIPDDAKVEIEGGVVYLDEDGGKSTGFESYFRKWRKEQNTQSLIVECPKDKLEAVKAAIKAAGGKVA